MCIAIVAIHIFLFLGGNLIMANPGEVLTWNERATIKGILVGYKFEELSDFWDVSVDEIRAAYKSAWEKLSLNEIGLGDFTESSSEHTPMDPYFWKR